MDMYGTIYNKDIYYPLHSLIRELIFRWVFHSLSSILSRTTKMHI